MAAIAVFPSENPQISDEGNGVYSILLNNLHFYNYTGQSSQPRQVNLEDGEYKIRIRALDLGFDIISNPAVRFTYSASPSQQSAPRNILQMAIDKIKEFFS